MAFSCEYVDLALSKLRSLLPIAADAPSGSGMGSIHYHHQLYYIKKGRFCDLF